MAQLGNAEKHALGTQEGGLMPCNTVARSRVRLAAPTHPGFPLPGSLNEAWGMVG